MKIGDLNLVDELVEDFYDRPIPNNAEELMTPLYQALICNQIPIAKRLIELKMNLDDPIPKEMFWTPLHKYFFFFVNYVYFLGLLLLV